MPAGKMIALHERFEAQALELRAAVGTTGKCLIDRQVFYRLPDTPSILQEFLDQQVDEFEPGRALLQRLTAFEKRVRDATTLTGLTAIYDEWAVFADQTMRHWDKEAWKFVKPASITFNTEVRAHMPAIVARIPYPGVRKFMMHWIETIEGTPKILCLRPRMDHSLSGEQGAPISSVTEITSAAKNMIH